MLSKLLLSVLALAVAVSSLPIAKRGSGVAIEVKSSSQFCFYLPPHKGGDIAASEDNAIPACTDTSLASGAIQFPTGFIKSAHYVSTSGYVQVTGRIDRTQYGLKASDGGGQMDNLDLPKGTCNGYKHFVNLVEPDADVYCIRCCKDSSDCNLGKSQYGCERVVPGDYS
ncbi:hypothetical protein INT43_000024 [Umbelopsis isabellina]|uniref:Uncharacterized protein n=1 Tax=Mortierella isabellina TaxID=91625 RepID=A0A8H7PEW8_MORIS|nr:hypothetical protein INT43_000024 [Umbelopsis isabellina]